jgi:hypothetical protein
MIERPFQMSINQREKPPFQTRERGLGFVSNEKERIVALRHKTRERIVTFDR